MDSRSLAGIIIAISAETKVAASAAATPCQQTARLLESFREIQRLAVEGIALATEERCTQEPR